jgi:hypothetical protein
VVKTIITGSNDLKNMSWVEYAMSVCGWDITEVVTGEAVGVDAEAGRLAYERKIPIKQFLKDKTIKHSTARALKNILDKTNYAEALIVIQCSKSSTLKNTIELAEKKGLKVYVHKVRV